MGGVRAAAPDAERAHRADGLRAALLAKLWTSAAVAAGAAWAVETSASGPGNHPIRAAGAILGTYGVVYFAITYLLNVEECAKAFRRVGQAAEVKRDAKYDDAAGGGTGCVPTCLGQTTDAASWRNLSRLAPGQSIEVTTKKGESLKGTFASVFRRGHKPGAEASQRRRPASGGARVSLRSSKRLNYTLAGLANRCGCRRRHRRRRGREPEQPRAAVTFANLKPAIIGAGCAIGALVGTLVGSWLGARGATVLPREIDQPFKSLNASFNFFLGFPAWRPLLMGASGADSWPINAAPYS